MAKDSTATEEWKPFFQPTGRVPIATKDILSAIFDTERYDPDEPVSLLVESVGCIRILIC